VKINSPKVSVHSVVSMGCGHIACNVQWYRGTWTLAFTLSIKAFGTWKLVTLFVFCSVESVLPAQPADELPHFFYQNIAKRDDW